MKLSLTKNLEKAEATEIEGQFIAALHLRKLIVSHLQEKIENRRATSCKEGKYDSPGWSYQQADNIGYERALRDVINLLTEK
jgi:hypothetical protein